MIHWSQNVHTHLSLWGLFFQSESHEEYVDIEGYEEDESAQATKAVLDTSLAQDLQLTPENSDDEEHRPSMLLYFMAIGRGNNVIKFVVDYNNTYTFVEK